MKSVLQAGLWLSGCLSGSVLIASAASAQFVSIPVTNGNFALTRGGAANQYTGSITLLSPAGTINVTNAAQPIYQNILTITTNTPIGVYITGISGSVSLNDGRTASLNGTAAAKLETLATVTGVPSYRAAALIPVGSTVSFTVVAGSLDVPQAALSAYPTPQVTVPVSGGTFAVTAPAGAGFETLTVNSLLTPLGTTNLTLSFPILANPGNTAFPYVLNLNSQPVAIGGVVNGTIALNDGRTLAVRERLVRLTGTAQVTSAAPNNNYQFPAVYSEPVTLTGTFTGGSISVPEPVVVTPKPPTPPIITPPEPPQPTVTTPPPARPQELTFGFAQTLNLSTEIIPLPEVTPDPSTNSVSEQELAEINASAIAYSRVNPCVSAISHMGFSCR